MNVARPVCAIWLSAALTILASCPDEELGPGPCGDAGYSKLGRALEEALAEVIHVNAACGASDPDGSPDRPYSSLTAALAAAKPNAGVLISAGEYEAGAVADKPLWIVGAGASDVKVTGDDVGLWVASAGQVHIEGIGFVDTAGAGVACAGSECTLKAVSVDGVSAAAGGAAYGVYGGAGADVKMDGVDVAGAALTGVYLRQASGVLDGCSVSGSGYEGLRVLDTPDGAPVVVKGTTFTDNAVRGVVAIGAELQLTEETTITGTHRKAGAPDPGGDGVVAACATLESGAARPSHVTLAGSTVGGSERVGVLVTCGAVANLDGVTVRDSGKGSEQGSAPVAAGVWIQGAGQATITGTTIEDSRMTGLGVIGAATAEVSDSTVARTQLHPYSTPAAASVEIGDGILVAGEAAATVTACSLTDNARAAVIFDAGGAGSKVSENTIDNAKYGVVVQEQEGDLAPVVSGNTYSGIASGEEPGDLGLTVSSAPFPEPGDGSVDGPEPFPL